MSKTTESAIQAFCEYLDKEGMNFLFVGISNENIVNMSITRHDDVSLDSVLPHVICDLMERNPYFAEVIAYAFVAFTTRNEYKAGVLMNKINRDVRNR